MKLFVVMGIGLGMIPTAYAGPEFQFFKDSGIHYWGEPTKAAPLVSGGNLETLKNAGTFPWNKYLDPKNDEFFKEGDYTPPAPFMEIARNPSDDNIRNWFKYLETKNDLARRLQGKLEEFAKRDSGSGFGDPSKMESARLLTKASAQVGQMAIIEPESKDYKLRLYFDSRCPHCEHMMETLSALMERGFYVELRRVDQAGEYHPKYPFVIQQATPRELAQNKIEAVPVLMVGDLKTQTVFRIQGYQSPEEVIAAIRQARRTGNPKTNEGGTSS